MNKKLGICLSGGGARGIAHIGVLQALEEGGISPYFVSGASAGSIVGALYSAGYSPKNIWRIVETTNIFKMFRPTLGLGLIDLSNLAEELGEHLVEDSFEALQRQFFIAVTNMYSGEVEIKSTGELFRWVQASSAIPLIFKPVEVDKVMYADGGVLNNLPVEPLLEVCEKVIGVSVIPIKPIKTLGGLFGIGERSMDLMINANSKANLAKCAVQLELVGVEEYNLFEFNKMEEIYHFGYEYTKKRMPEILATLA